MEPVFLVRVCRHHKQLVLHSHQVRSFFCHQVASRSQYVNRIRVLTSEIDAKDAEISRLSAALQNTSQNTSQVSHFIKL